MTGPIDTDALTPFHPIIRGWFVDRIGRPTNIQREAWPRIARGEHVLLSAPTGSGKTLAAFLWAINQLATGAWTGGTVRVLYVSPLKALNTDVRRNLLGPLEEFRERFATSGVGMPEIRVLTRSGDTPTDERQRMARRPPEILVTTPESLNILLTSRRGRLMLSGVAAVILDEIHAVVGSKRGVHLITAIERLSHLAGEVQRVALSATVRPLDRVAEWVGGYSSVGEGESILHAQRKVIVVASPGAKRYDVKIAFPAAGLEMDPSGRPGSEAYWELFLRELKKPIRRNRSTLVFANSRRMVEKLTRLINEGEEEELAFSHHGSLAREIRSVVEDRLKKGQLRSIVATSSLELGIDIGALDEVVLVQTPPSVASTVQRIGRSGHAVGATSRGLFLPLVARDLIDAVVVAHAALAGEIEEVQPILSPLDVLAQIIVSMTATETWRIADLSAVLRGSYPYHLLTDQQLQIVLDMLSGRYAEIRLPALKPVITIDMVSGTVRGREGAERLIYLAGGTIPDRGYFNLRREDTGSLLGELDEEFVWERAIGDTFTLGVQSWRLARVTHNDVYVTPIHSRAAMAPFWRADERDRTFDLAERTGQFLERAESCLDSSDFAAKIGVADVAKGVTAQALQNFLQRQRANLGGVLPHRHRLVIEYVSAPLSVSEPSQVILHTLWGGKVNRPLALALKAAWQEQHGVPIEVSHDDDCIIISTTAVIPSGELAPLLVSLDVESHLRASLESTGFFGARFRTAASCALLLPREGFRSRTPLWLSRQRSKDLLTAVRRFDDFPLLLEAWRSCLQEDMDLDHVRQIQDELRSGDITVTEVRTDHPSPFALHVLWKRTNQLMYADDGIDGSNASNLRTDLLKEVLHTSHLRPKLSPSLVDQVRRKLQRTYPGYPPRTASELFDWLIERGFFPIGEWRDLHAAMERENGAEVANWLDELLNKAVLVNLPGREEPALVAAIQALPRISRALGLSLSQLRLRPLFADSTWEETRLDSGQALPTSPTDEGLSDPLAELVMDLLRFSGPVEVDYPAQVLGLDEALVSSILEDLVEERRIVVDQLLDGATSLQVCESECLERLLRLTRARGRPVTKPLPLPDLPLFLASWQGLTSRGGGIDDLRRALDHLFAYPAPAGLWESDLLPARLEPYQPAWLDALLAEGDLGWLGCGEGRLTFLLRGDRELIESGLTAGEAFELEDIFPRGPGRFDFSDLLTHTGLDSKELTTKLWRLVWEGKVSNESFTAVRRGVGSRFAPLEFSAENRHKGGRRQTFSRWQHSRPFSGSWYRLESVAPPADALIVEELSRDRARLLLARYGVIFRELIERELPGFEWRSLFRSLRLMELSGEVVTGELFSGIHGVQFALPEALRMSQEGLVHDAVWWVNALDPAAPCGLGFAEFAGYPRRLPGNHLVFHGPRCVVMAEGNGKRLQIQVPAHHPLLPAYLSFITHLLTRSFTPMRGVNIETINGEPASTSRYRDVLSVSYQTTSTGKGLRLGRMY